MGNCLLSPTETGKRHRTDEREGQERKRNRNESEETEEIKTFHFTLTLPNGKPISVGRPGDVRYVTPWSHTTIPGYSLEAPIFRDRQ